MKKLRITLGVLVLILTLSSMKISAVNIVPYGEITGKKTEPSTTEPSTTEPSTTEPEGTETLPSEENNGGTTSSGFMPRIHMVPPLFSRGRIETIFPVSYKVPEQWLGEFAYDQYNDPSMFYYPGLHNFDRAVQVTTYAIDREGETDEAFLRYIAESTENEDEYVTFQYELEQGPDFPYVHISMEKDNHESLAFVDRFYRILEDRVILFQCLVFDEPDDTHLADVEAMFLSQYIDDTKAPTPSNWKSITHEKAVFRYPETWDFVDMETADETVQGIMHQDGNGLTFLSVIEDYDMSHYEADSDYFNGFASYAQWHIDHYQNVEIVGVDLYADSAYTMHMRFFGTAVDIDFEIQLFTMLDTIDNRIYSLTLETPAEPSGPNWEMIELFDTIVESYEIIYDPSVGQA